MAIPLSEPQYTVASCSGRFRVLVSGRRFGKTFLAMGELIRFACSRNNNKCWYVAPSYRMAKQILWESLKSALLPKNMVMRINESDLSMILINGSLIALKGAENYDSMRGMGLDFVVIDEFADIDKRAWYEVVRPTLSDTGGHALFCGTPKGFNWAYDIYQAGLDAEQADWSSFQYTTLEGGNVPDEEIHAARNDLDERTFTQEYEAGFVNFEGRVYYNFNREENCIGIENDGSELHIGMDFNVNPMTAVVANVTDNVIKVFGEVNLYGSNTYEMVGEIRRRYGDQRCIIYPDPTCNANKTSAGGKTDLSILQENGFPSRYRHGGLAIRDRVNAVNAKLKSASGNISLFVDPKCKNLVQCLERQIYHEGTSQPDKTAGFDHMNDALGYFVEYLYPVDKETIKHEKLIGLQ